MGAAPCLLSLGTICGCIAVACVAIAFSTDNWLEYSVNRVAILTTMSQTSDDPQYAEVPLNLNRTLIYFPRTIGLWRICFPMEIPYGVDVYRSPTDTSCVNVDYPKDLDSGMDAWNRARVHLMRTILALFIAGFAMELLSFFVGVFGCWRRSPGLLVTTGTFMILAWLLDAGALAIWHGVDYMETKRMQFPTNVYYTYRTWPPILQQYTTRNYSWSFMLAWIGCGMALVSAMFLLGGAASLRAERRREKERNAQYMLPVYGNYGEKNAPYYAHAYPGPHYYYSSNSYRY
ncbi:uncharacterized protein LOC129594241 [Paramacrobiotus metropolitanus]|uniref:uncharacterized protein LOC129594241 n=1 Tax=Paramacrobiotus metropolitanus TaxID=2943436 RepID=UPI002445BA4D|nr:uncharacterized protein LOC129594241 [Paramacrobiotus metropolitanus]